MNNSILVTQALNLRQKVMDLAFNEICSFERFSRLIYLSYRLEQRAKRRNKKFCRQIFDKMTDEILSAGFIG